MTFHAEWNRLWRLAASTGDEPPYAFERIGLLLEDPGAPGDWDYPATPVDAVTFASTGGDGVHFSLVPQGPAVVMTVPRCFGNTTHVLAESLPEFLALGCRTGYFSLERLAYGWGRADQLADLRLSPPSDDPLLKSIVEEFGVSPWPDVEGRLAALEAAHRAHIRTRA